MWDGRLATGKDLEAVGTDAHEQPIVMAALANDDAEPATPYRVLDEWRHIHDGDLLIALPDAWAMSAFVCSAPTWPADWTGFPPDSVPLIAADERLLRRWAERAVDQTSRLLILFVGPDVHPLERVEPVGANRRHDGATTPSSPSRPRPGVADPGRRC